MKKLLTILIFSLSIIPLFAQRPGGHRGGGPETMLAREKQMVIEKITDLSDDQKLLIDGIYDEFTVTIKETFEENRDSGNRESMREKMQALRKEKNGLIKDVLNESQYTIYESITQRKRERRAQPSSQD